MIEINLEDIFSETNINLALDYLHSKRESVGSDGIALSELDQYWKVNGEKIKRNILDGDYHPGVVKEIEIINCNGKKRNISIINSADRLILRTIVQKVQPLCENLLSDNCYAFREGKGVIAAVNDAADHIQSGYLWMCKIDIKNYFESISLSKVQSLIAKTFSDRKIVALLQRYLTVRVEQNDYIKRKRKGILTGSPISPLIANLYLASLDFEYMNDGYRYCRYADDIVVFTKTYEDAELCLNQLTEVLKEKYQLQINKKKSGIYKALDQIYLGYQFDYDVKNRLVTAVRNRKERQEVYRKWKTSGIQRVDRNYHLVNDGVLTKKDYTILFDSESGKKYIPVETTDSIAVYSNVTFSSDFFRFLSDKKIYLTIVNKYGDIVGHYYGRETASQARTMIKQSEVYLNQKSRLALAKSMEVAFIHNINANLKYYARRTNSDTIKTWSEKFKTIKSEIDRASNTTELLMIEARCRQEYYGLFNDIISLDGFGFTSRTRRPPRDPLNAMISFGNTLLYNRIAMEIYKSSLDIRIGIVHSTTARSQTLNLDLADIFKPILVDRTIFTLINRKIISLERDFERNEEGGVYLSNTGKRIFIGEFNKKLSQRLTENGKSVSYDTKIKQEISKLYRFYMYGEKYKPYKYTN